MKSPPDDTTIVRNGIVAPSLQFVGYVERIERVGIGVVELLEEFEKILRLIQGLTITHYH
jgi:hypothetical protein